MFFPFHSSVLAVVRNELAESLAPPCHTSHYSVWSLITQSVILNNDLFPCTYTWCPPSALCIRTESDALTTPS